MPITRRHLLRRAGAVTLGFAGLRHVAQNGFAAASEESTNHNRYGAFVPDPAGIIDLPEGFTYRVFSKWGQTMDDGLLVPGKHDGMAAFPGPDGKTILVRNHEIADEAIKFGPFGENNQLAGKVDSKSVYDVGRNNKGPWRGGTTTIVYDTKKQAMERHFLSLIGTKKNCAGGPTPWNTWITCEEWTQRADDRCAVDHGYCFEVPATDKVALAEPVPLKALGRFRHEAVAVEPETGIVYLTEDEQDSLIYRLLPEKRGDLRRGGRLQALVLGDGESVDTRNWRDKQGRPLGPNIEVGPSVTVRWIDVEDPENPGNNLRHRMAAKGAAIFARGEGMWYGRKSVFFACTTGGEKQLGQIWRYVPSRLEGQPDEARFPSRLQLFIEPNDPSVIENADNLTVAPWGDLFVCEDGKGEQFVVRVTPDGRLSRFARNAISDHEFAGACFSPDGSTFFVNIQGVGITLAITGPWHKA